MGTVVRKTLAECRLSDERKLELAELAKLPDSEIDLEEMPELTEKFWQNAVPNPFYKPVKRQVTVRIDADILAWLRQNGAAGYQSRLNALLRQVMVDDLRGKRKRA